VSIYETLGGNTSIGEAVDKFYARLESDPVLSEFFRSADVEQIKTRQRMFLTAALGGPDAYEGRDMRAAHAYLPITDTDFDLFIDHLAATLGEVGVAPEQIAEVLEALRPLRLEIVTAPAEGADEWGSLDPTGGSG
jgi:hemoglobin